MAFTNNTVVGNSASTGGGGMYFADSTGTRTNNAIAYQVDGDGLFALDGTYGSGVTPVYSDFYANAPADLGGTFLFSTSTGGNIMTELDFVSWTADGACSNDLLAPPGTSALTDAEDPTILDLDGTVSDIGAMGGPGAAGIDADHDGYVADLDCDESDAAVNPGAVEVCGGIDDDCDGVPDGDTLDSGPTWYVDADGDGFGDVSTAVLACTQPEGDVSDGTDCDDAEPATYPGAAEVLDDGVDQDCDGADGNSDTGDTDSGDTDSGDTDSGDTDSGPNGGNDDPDCGCATSSTAAPAAMLLASFGVLLRGRARAPRRRSRPGGPASPSGTKG